MPIPKVVHLIPVRLLRYFHEKMFPLVQGFPTCGTRTTGGTRKLSKWYARSFSKNAKKSICFHRNSHPEKSSNVNLAPVHFLLLLNYSTCKYAHAVYA